MKYRTPETTIAASIASWPSGLEQAVFGTGDPRGIFDLLNDFCVAALGAHTRDVVFYVVGSAPSSGSSSRTVGGSWSKSTAPRSSRRPHDLHDRLGELWPHNRSPDDMPGQRPFTDGR
jgi:hypothetical protein